MTQTASAAAFLPFLKKKPVAVPPPPKEEEDPLALPIPKDTLGKYSSSTAQTKFISKLNKGKQGSKPASASNGPNRNTLPPKGTCVAGTTKLSGPAAVAAAARKAPGGSNAAAGRPRAAVGKPGPTAGKAGAAAGKPPVLSPAQAKAEAEKRKIKQLERLAKLGALAKDAPPEVLAKVEEAKQQLSAIERQKQLEEKRRLQLEQQRKQQVQARQAQEQERLRLLAEKQRLQAGKGKGGPAAATAVARPPASSTAGAAAAGSGPGRGPGPAAGQQGISKGPLSSSSAAGSSRGPSGQLGGARQPSQQQQQQQGRDPYAGLNPKQRAFLLARKREREGRMAGRSGGGSGPRSDGYGDPNEYDEYDEYDDMDDFIDDDEGDDWRRELRAMTGYDPRKYNDSFFDDRRMEASAAEIAAEERRSARIGRTEDEKEAEEEARRLAAKAAKKGKKKGASALFDD